MNSKEQVAKFKSIYKNHKLQTNAKPISYENAVSAEKMLDNLKLNTTEDYFLFCASLNLLNSYVKKPYANSYFKKNYSFKYKINKLIEQFFKNPVNDVRIDATRSLTMITVFGMQFSFHYPPLKQENLRSTHVKDVWEGLRLQPIAEEVFDFAQLINKNKKANYEEINEQ